MIDRAFFIGQPGNDAEWLDRHPIIGLLLAPWIGVFYALVIVAPLALMAAVIFGLLLLGDALGFYEFDSGLGGEDGDR